jgi:hypothetical protein
MDHSTPAMVWVSGITSLSISKAMGSPTETTATANHRGGRMRHQYLNWGIAFS